MAKTCGACGKLMTDTELVCECGAGSLAYGQNQLKSSGTNQNAMDVVAIFGYLGVLLGCFFATSQLLMIGSAQSAPQQAAVAAMAAAYAVVPYCAARALGEIARHLKGR